MPRPSIPKATKVHTWVLVGPLPRRPDERGPVLWDVSCEFCGAHSSAPTARWNRGDLRRCPCPGALAAEGRASTPASPASPAPLRKPRRLISVQGRSLTPTEWARETMQDPQKIYYRLRRQVQDPTLTSEWVVYGDMVQAPNVNLDPKAELSQRTVTQLCDEFLKAWIPQLVDQQTELMRDVINRNLRPLIERIVMAQHSDADADAATLPSLVQLPAKNPLARNAFYDPTPDPRDAEQLTLDATFREAREWDGDEFARFMWDFRDDYKVVTLKAPGPPASPNPSPEIQRSILDMTPKERETWEARDKSEPPSPACPGGKSPTGEIRKVDEHDNVLPAQGDVGYAMHGFPLGFDPESPTRPTHMAGRPDLLPAPRVTYDGKPLLAHPTSCHTENRSLDFLHPVWPRREDVPVMSPTQYDEWTHVPWVRQLVQGLSAGCSDYKYAAIWGETAKMARSMDDRIAALVYPPPEQLRPYEDLLFTLFRSWDIVDHWHLNLAIECCAVLKWMQVDRFKMNLTPAELEHWDRFLHRLLRPTYGHTTPGAGQDYGIVNTRLFFAEFLDQLRYRECDFGPKAWALVVKYVQQYDDEGWAKIAALHFYGRDVDWPERGEHPQGLINRGLEVGVLPDRIVAAHPTWFRDSIRPSEGKDRYWETAGESTVQDLLRNTFRPVPERAAHSPIPRGKARWEESDQPDRWWDAYPLHPLWARRQGHTEQAEM